MVRDLDFQAEEPNPFSFNVNDGQILKLSANRMKVESDTGVK
jgi:hypothetical protein